MARLTNRTQSKRRSNPSRGGKWGVKTWPGGPSGGAWSRKKDAQDYAKRLREANRQAGQSRPVSVVRVRELENPSSKSVHLTNFTGTIARVRGGQVKITGRQRKAKR